MVVVRGFLRLALIPLHGRGVTRTLMIATVWLWCAMGLAIAEPGMAPPSNHWVFKLPPAAQQEMVLIGVRVLDAADQPVGHADVLAYCEPWDFTRRGSTGERGSWTVKGPKGDWTFYATKPGRGPNGIVAALRRVKVDRNASVIVRPTQRMQFTPMSSQPSAIQLTFTPTDLPSPVTSLNCGSLARGQRADWWLTADVAGIAAVTQEPDTTCAGLLQFIPLKGASPPRELANAIPFGQVRITLESHLAADSWWNLYFDPLDHEGGTQGVFVRRVPPGGATYRMAVSPGRYRIYACFQLNPPDGKLVYVAWFAPQIATVVPGKPLDLAYSTRLQVKNAGVTTIVWGVGAHLWFDLADSKGNYVDSLAGTATLRVSQDGVRAYDGPVTDCSSRYVFLKEPLSKMRPGKPIYLEYMYQSPVLGKMEYRGQLPYDKPFCDFFPVIAESQHFELRSRAPTPYGTALLEVCETAHSWLAENYAGPIHPASLKRFVLGFSSPVGVGWASVDYFYTDIYSAGKLVPDSPRDLLVVLFHELGHLYQGSPPHHQANGMDSGTRESQANMVALYCLRAVRGERLFREWRQVRSNQFFEDVLGTAQASEGERHHFLLLYIDAKYGQRVNRDFFRTVYADEGNCGQVLLSMDFLTNEYERGAALYSFLAGDNLAWLYRWARLPVSDEVVDRAMRAFREGGAKAPAPTDGPKPATSPASRP